MKVPSPSPAGLFGCNEVQAPRQPHGGSIVSNLLLAISLVDENRLLILDLIFLFVCFIA